MGDLLTEFWWIWMLLILFLGGDAPKKEKRA